MIHARGLTKRYGATLAVDDVSFTAHPGRITALVGPTGAGKTTLMRMVLGLDRPTHGAAFIAGHRFVDLRRPLTKVGAVLDPGRVYPHRSARMHLRWLASAGGVPVRRVEEVLELADVVFAADQQISSFSDGMLQRLAIAGALLGDPTVLIVDGPFDNHEPGDIVWVQGVLTRFAEEGRTVLVTGLTVTDIAMIADDLVLLDQGRLVADCTTDHFLARVGGGTIQLRSPQLQKLADALRAHDITTGRADMTRAGDKSGSASSLVIAACDRREAGTIAAREQIVLSDVSCGDRSLEDTVRTVIAEAGQWTPRNSGTYVSHVDEGSHAYR